MLQVPGKSAYFRRLDAGLNRQIARRNKRRKVPQKSPVTFARMAYVHQTLWFQPVRKPFKLDSTISAS